MTESESFEGAPEDAVLRGWLNRLFDNPLIGFDPSGGDFFFTKHPAGKASVDGEGDAAEWTIRALERRGYSITQREDAEIRIRIIRQEDPEKCMWELSCAGEIREFGSIHELMKEL
jgi:iron complex transport system ATP-binding protein